MTGYIICTAPRSGSTLLCHMLAATGVAGDPKSLFNGPELAVWAKRVGVPTVEDQTELARPIFEAAYVVGSAGTNVFGLRLQRHSFPLFSDVLAGLYPDQENDFARLEKAFGSLRCIHLKRRDKLRQAASFVRATQTGLWHRAADGSELERLAPPAEPRFDRDEMDAAVSQSEAYDAAWEDWFHANSLSQLRLTYEELSADPKAVLRAVLMYLDLDPGAADKVSVPTQKLADAVTEAWVERVHSG